MTGHGFNHGLKLNLNRIPRVPSRPTRGRFSGHFVSVVNRSQLTKLDFCDILGGRTVRELYSFYKDAKRIKNIRASPTIFVGFLPKMKVLAT
jgi:hypothetical protein